jgi:DNA-binding transcriptional MocR family regulator
MTSPYRRKGRKVGKDGRNSEHQYWNLPYSMMQSPAYRLLSGSALKVLHELRGRFNGYNNGRIFLSYEDAASQLAMSKSTVKRAFDELQVVGFIVLKRQGVWHGRKASEWRVTFESTEGQTATHDWKQWQAPQRRKPPQKIKPRYPNGIPACFDGAEPVPEAI